MRTGKHTGVRRYTRRSRALRGSGQSGELAVYVAGIGEDAVCTFNSALRTGTDRTFHVAVRQCGDATGPFLLLRRLCRSGHSSLPALLVLVAALFQSLLDVRHDGRLDYSEAFPPHS